MASPSYREITLNGLWKNNPALVQLLGLCPLLGVSNSAVNALGLALASAVLVNTDGTPSMAWSTRLVVTLTIWPLAFFSISAMANCEMWKKPLMLVATTCWRTESHSACREASSNNWMGFMGVTPSFTTRSLGQ